MANTRYIALKPLNPGRPVEVLERDDKGALVGAWFGYWNFKKGTVALYPNVANHNVNWPGGVIPSGRQVISDRMVERKGNAPSPSQQAAPPLPEGEAYGRVQNAETKSCEARGGVQQSIKFY